MSRDKTTTVVDAGSPSSVGITVTVYSWANYLGRTYTHLAGIAPRSSDFDTQSASVVSLLIVLLLVMGFCVDLAMAHRRSVIWVQMLAITLSATASLFLYVFFRRHGPQFLPSGGFGLGPEINFDAFNRMYQLTVVLTVCFVMLTLAFVGGILSDATERKTPRIWIAFLAGLLFAVGAVLAYYKLFASPHHSEPDMLIQNLLPQFHTGLSVCSMIISAFVIALGWIGNRTNAAVLVRGGSSGVVAAIVVAVLCYVKSNTLSDHQSWYTMDQYDICQWVFASVGCMVFFALSALMGFISKKKVNRWSTMRENRD